MLIKLKHQVSTLFTNTQQRSSKVFKRESSPQFPLSRPKTHIAMAAIIEETHSAPQWLDRTFLQTALREGLRRASLDINTYSIKPATKPGDNYLSQMFRVSANVVSSRKTAEDVTFVIKSLPKGESAEKYVAEMQVFAREMKMLSVTLPMMHKILHEIHEPKLSAQLYFLQTEPAEILILEDLCRTGFRSVNRLDYLDLPHGKLVAERLALFHAASLVAFEKDPSLRTAYYSSAWNDEHTGTEKFFTEGLISMQECLRRWGIYPELLKKLEKTDPKKLLEKLYKVATPEDGEFFVLNHGDPWTSNIMFKYNDQQPTDLRFVDFQLSCVNSPAYDLLYFITTSLKLNIRTEKTNEILETYYKKLTETCQKLNIVLKLSFDDLVTAYYEKIFLGFFLFVTLVPFMSVPSEDAIDINEALNSNITNTNLKQSLTENYRKVVEKMLPYFVENGCLD